MSWDNDDFEVPVIKDNDKPILESWDDEFTTAGNDDDAEILESWDAEEKPKTKPAAKQTQTNNKKKNTTKSGNDKVLLEIDTLDEKTRKELLKKAEIESDLNNAADLFGGLGITDEHPKARAARLKAEQDSLLLKPAGFTKDTPIESHPLFAQAETKQDFDNLRKSLSKAITSMNQKSPLYYSSHLTVDLIRDISKPMSIENIRQAVATLNVVIKEKERQERQARLAKVKGGTATGGAGKKKAKAGNANLGGAFKKENDIVVDQFDDYGDFGDDDFM
ncbi:related to Eukaryotic translation initiation factor 3 subunit J [Saccharomycodes ludwigii]|uniref:Eukaryotic translation initiation factor 3 subunit J n=1 Tax=Saccharomycodes ludwigii TaxID=36035 RepID=A0A376BAH1_9ASCO|nr:related to Eukaryotic translation initiation factor 3 subunit J [Saccharomycodes ludwigii]